MQNSLKDDLVKLREGMVVGLKKDWIYHRW